MGMALGEKEKRKREKREWESFVCSRGMGLTAFLFLEGCWIGLVRFGYCAHDHLGRSTITLYSL